MRASDDDLIAITERAGIVDCVHYGSAVVVGRSGDIRWSVGNPYRIVFERSTTKPLRALALLRSGCAKRFDFDEADIALIAGSHSGALQHVTRARSILNKGGIAEGELQCGVRLPIGDDALFDLLSGNERLSVFHCDCSAEHLGALAMCKYLGFPLTTYLQDDHPVQRLYKSTVNEFSSEYSPRATTTDRCGMPTSAVELVAIALRFSRLIQAREHDSSIDHLIRAIGRHPTTYTGNRRIIGSLIERSSGDLFGKCGAEGLYAISWPSGDTLSLKVSDGAPRAAVAVLYRAARALRLDVPDIWDCVNGNEFADVRAAG